MAPHTVDGDTVGHWEFDGDGSDDSGNGNNMVTGTYIGAPVQGRTDKSSVAMHPTAPLRMNTYSAVLDYITWANYDMTIAACVWFDSLASSADICRFEAFAGGQAKWRMRCLSDGRIGMSLDTVGGFITATSTATISLQTWTWVAVTVNTDGKSGKFRIGAIEESWALANPTNVGGSSQSLTIHDAWNTVPGLACMYSLIMKDISATSGQLNDMQAQTGL